LERADCPDPRGIDVHQTGIEIELARGGCLNRVQALHIKERGKGVQRADGGHQAPYAGPNMDTETL
jgi:hypothetical protein